jgi:hypothetical protein
VANDLTKNPLKIDTAGTALITKSFTPTLAVWVGATAGHTLLLKDVAGSTIMSASAVTATDFLPFPPDFTIGGLTATTVQSGTVWLYYKEKAPLS